MSQGGLEEMKADAICAARTQVYGSAECLDLPASLTVIGQATPVTVHVRDAHGVSKLTATLTQNGSQYQVWQSTAPSKTADTTFNFDLGAKTTPQLRDGHARLVIEVASGGLVHSTARLERDVNVVTQPPTVSADSQQHYLYLGMPISQL